jgi:hypothetical protein
MNGIPEAMSLWAWIFYVAVPMILFVVLLVIYARPSEPAQPTNEEDLAELSDEQKHG